MGDSIDSLFAKRRSRSSNSSNSSANESPDAKKSRNSLKPNSDSQEANLEEEDMADEGVSEKLNVILQKLEKLDLIEHSVNNLQMTLLKLEARTQTLETFQACAATDIEELKKSLNFIEENHKTTLDGLKKQHKDTVLKLESALETQNSELDDKIKDLETKNLYLEAYSRRENIKFENIPEDDSRAAGENTEETLRNFLETELGFVNAGDVEIQRVHRLGKKKDDEPRSILARFLRYKDCEDILSLGKRLRGSEYKMYQDLPYEIVQRRKKQMNTFKSARLYKIPAAFSKAQPDKLYIRGKLWPVGKVLENPGALV